MPVSFFISLLFFFQARVTVFVRYTQVNSQAGAELLLVSLGLNPSLITVCFSRPGRILVGLFLLPGRSSMVHKRRLRVSDNMIIKTKKKKEKAVARHSRRRHEKRVRRETREGASLHCKED